MKEIFRIVEHRASLSSYRATHDEERAVQLELLMESTKPKNLYPEWHYLIATPFRYTPPFKNARFRPPFARRNVFYGSNTAETAFYEYAFHFMRERLHLKVESGPEQRTQFCVKADDHHAQYIESHSEYEEIMDKNNYEPSHQYVSDNPDVTFIVYPSCRDPLHRDNAAVLNIQHLAKEPTSETSIRLFYDYQKKQLTWINSQLRVHWEEVA